jgi:hypothetical protein
MMASVEILKPLQEVREVFITKRVLKQTRLAVLVPFLLYVLRFCEVRW